jgi:hypothetical protein
LFLPLPSDRHSFIASVNSVEVLFNRWELELSDLFRRGV